MSRAISFGVVRALLFACAFLCFAGHAAAQTLVETSAETRFQMDLQVPDAALATYLPAGWTFNVATQGPATGVNLRVEFIDRLTINGSDGRPLGKGSNRLIYLAVPVKDPSGEAVQLIIGGLTEDPSNAPGPFGNYMVATSHSMQWSTTSSGAGPVLVSQDWDFSAASGEHLELHIKYERGVGIRRDPSDVKFYSAKNPASFQISRQQQVVDVTRNVTTTPPDRVKEFSFKGSGGSFSKIFGGTVKFMSWDDILWFNGSVLLP
jgi:hypothetical protein